MLTPTGNGLIEFAAFGGTADNAVTGAIAYPIGATSIAVSALPTGGYINAGQKIMFHGDENMYTVSAGIADLTLGGTITLSTPLIVAIPATPVPIWTGGEIKRPAKAYASNIVSGVLLGKAPNPARNWYASGEVVQIWLTNGYDYFDHTHKNNRTLSEASSGIVEIGSHGVNERFKFGVSMIKDDRGVGLLSDAIALESIFDGMMNGGDFIFFPDRQNHPGEYMSCVLNKRPELKRRGKIGIFDYAMDVRVVPSSQGISSLPVGGN